MKLAEKFGEDPTSWEVVAKYLIKKSTSEYYTDPVVQFGYCRGSEPVNYVKQIMHRYTQYRAFYSNQEADSTQIVEASLIH